MAAIDAAHLQCVIVCHRDQPHPHVHCIVNRVDPADGRMAVLSKDRERLSQWAHAYESERGPLLTPKRAERHRSQAERTQPDRTQLSDTPAPDSEPSQRVMLAQFDAAQRERHAQEWQALDAALTTRSVAVPANKTGTSERLTSARIPRRARLRIVVLRKS